MKKKFLFLLFLVTNLFASLGQINAIKGNVVLKRNNNTFKVYENTKIQPNDSFITKNNSKIQIILNNGTLLTLFQKSNITFNNTILLKQGSLKVLTKNPIKINTIRSIIIPQEKTLCLIKNNSKNIEIKTIIGNLKFKLTSENKFHIIKTGKKLIFKADILNPIKISSLNNKIIFFNNYNNLSNEITNEVNEDITTQEVNELVDEIDTITNEVNEDITTQEINEDITTQEVNEDITTQEVNNDNDDDTEDSTNNNSSSTELSNNN